MISFKKFVLVAVTVIVPGLVYAQARSLINGKEATSGAPSDLTATCSGGICSLNVTGEIACTAPDGGTAEVHVTNTPQVIVTVPDGGMAGLPVVPVAADGGVAPVLMEGSTGTALVPQKMNAYGSASTYDIPNRPDRPLCVNLSANVAAPVCGLQAGGAYLVSCVAADSTFFAAKAPDAGAPDVGSQVAVSTDTPILARTARRMRLLQGETCISFLSGSATTCCASFIPIGP